MTGEGGSVAETEGDDETVSEHAGPEACDVAEYLTQILPELAKMAEQSGLDVAAYLLKVAQLEAEGKLREGRDQPA